MIELRETVTIDVPPEAVWAWLEAMPEHYLEWHEDHISCRWASGEGLTPGAVMEAEERLHGKPHRLRLALTAVESGRWFEYRAGFGIGGRFEVEALDGGTRFTAVIRVGVGTPVVGWLIDGLLRLTMGGRIESFRRHQAEEGANLKRLLEGAAA